MWNEQLQHIESPLIHGCLRVWEVFFGGMSDCIISPCIFQIFFQWSWTLVWSKRRERKKELRKKIKHFFFFFPSIFSPFFFFYKRFFWFLPPKLELSTPFYLKNTKKASPILLYIQYIPVCVCVCLLIFWLRIFCLFLALVSSTQQLNFFIYILSLSHWSPLFPLYLIPFYRFINNFLNAQCLCIMYVVI